MRRFEGKFIMNDQYISSVCYKGGLHKSSYLLNLPVVKFLAAGNDISFENSVTFFVGENGSGKSTIIEALAVGLGFNSEGGSKNFNFSTRETSYELCKCLTIARRRVPKDGYFLRAESFFNVASNVEELGVTGYGERSLHEQSHGESFLALFQNRFWGNGLYILDEPEAALSPLSQMALLSKVHELVNNNSQLIIATHSPILLSYPGATIFQLDSDGLTRVSYEESDIYNMYKDFILDHKHTLHYLLNKDRL
jgi:predicted ATPase